jgi:hypothetical protein
VIVFVLVFRKDIRIPPGRLELWPAPDQLGKVLHYKKGPESWVAVNNDKNRGLRRVKLGIPVPAWVGTLVLAKNQADFQLFLLVSLSEPNFAFSLDAKFESVGNIFQGEPLSRDHTFFKQNFRINQPVEVVGAHDHKGVIVACTLREGAGDLPDDLRFLVLSKGKVTELKKFFLSARFQIIWRSDISDFCQIFHSVMNSELIQHF